MIEKREFYINGRWVAPATPRDCPVIDPSTEEVCAVISLGDQADTDAAVAAAKAAFPAWAATPPAERRACGGPHPRAVRGAEGGDWPRPSAWRWARPSTCARTIRPPACRGT